MRMLTVAFVVVLGTACRHHPPSPTAPSSSTTFNLAGVVVDTVLRPVRDANVEIVEDGRTRQSTATDENGRFTFPPFTAAATLVTLRITKAEYALVGKQVGNKSDLWITLTPLTSVDARGQFQITFIADDVCWSWNEPGGGEVWIPRSLQTRTYTVTTTPSTSRSFAIAIGGGEFTPGHDSFWGTVANDAALFYVYSLDAITRWQDNLPIIERLDATRYLSWMGTTKPAEVKADGSMEAALEGTIAYCALAKEPTPPGHSPSCAVQLSECKSSRHRVVLSRK